MKQWKALYVNARHEKKIQQKLLEIGIEAYVPVQRQLRQWSDRKKWVDVVLIGGYVFVRVVPQERDKVFKVEGVLNYVRVEGADAVVKDWEIEQMKKIIQTGYTISVENVGRDYFKQGDFIRVKEGYFKDWEGVVYREKNPDLLEIHVKSINMVFRILVPKAIIEKK